MLTVEKHAIPINIYPACAIPLYPNNLLLLSCSNAPALPTVIVITAITAIMYVQSVYSKINKNILINNAKPADLLAIDRNVTIGVGPP